MWWEKNVRLLSKQAIVILIRLKFIGSVFDDIDGNDYTVNELK